MYSFLLIGQSNMAGRGRLQEAVAVDTARIYTLRMGRWQKMFRPINPDRQFAGVSLAERFAERFAAQHDADVGLIPCADGGTRLEQWMPDTVLYDNAVMNARLAMRTSTPAGILWHQGESDCVTARAQVYGDKLLSMLTRLRKDIGAEHLPLLLGGLGDFLIDYGKPEAETSNYPLINEQLKAVANALPHAAFVSAEGLGHNGDCLHFNAQALYTFGERYFDAYRRLTDGHAPADGTDGALTRSAMETL